MEELLAKIENETGFSVFEYTGGSQLVFYGTSDKFDDFKALTEDFDTGTMVYLMDTKETKMYSLYKKEWY